MQHQKTLLRLLRELDIVEEDLALGDLVEEGLDLDLVEEDLDLVEVGRCRQTECDVFSRQLCRECSHLVAAWTQTEDP